MTARVRRLMFLTDAPAFGGAERYILSLSAAARRAGIEPVVCWAKPAHAPAELFTARDASLPVFDLPSAGDGAFAFLRALHRVLREFHPDAVIVNASGRRGFWTACGMMAALGIPVAWVHHMIEGRDHRRATPRRLGGRMEGLQLWRVPQALRHLAAGQIARLVVTSNPDDAGLVTRWHRVPPERVQVIPPGIDTTIFAFDTAARSRLRAEWSATDDALVIGTAARLVEGKGLDTLIDAGGILHDRGFNITLALAGEGPQRDALAQRADRLGLGERVRFLGQFDDMAAFHSACDVSVLASRTESFGLSIAEAMACERPVITTPTAGARRQIVHRRTGWLLGGFEAAELADAVAALWATPATRLEFGQSARRSVLEAFDVQATLEQTLALLRAPTPARGARQELRVLPGVR